MISNVTDVVDNTVIKRPHSYKTKTGERGGRKLQHLCLDKTSHSEQEEQELIKREYVMYIPYKRKREGGRSQGYNTTLLKS